MHVDDKACMCSSYVESNVEAINDITLCAGQHILALCRSIVCCWQVLPTTVHLTMMISCSIYMSMVVWLALIHF